MALPTSGRTSGLVILQRFAPLQRLQAHLARRLFMVPVPEKRLNMQKTMLISAEKTEIM